MCHQASATAAELEGCVGRGAPRSFVAVYEGDIIAALLARPSAQAPHTPWPHSSPALHTHVNVSSSFHFLDIKASDSVCKHACSMRPLHCSAAKLEDSHDMRSTGAVCAQRGRLALALAVVQGDLEEAPEVVECLLAFYFHYLLADDRVTSVSQGRTPVLNKQLHGNSS